jgi:hypothetical protein
MGFNKRFVSKEIVVEQFKLKGYQGVLDYLKGSDVIIGLDEELDEVVNLALCDFCPTTKNLKIEKILYGNKVGE